MVDTIGINYDVYQVLMDFQYYQVRMNRNQLPDTSIEASNIIQKCSTIDTMFNIVILETIAINIIDSI